VSPFEQLSLVSRALRAILNPGDRSPGYEVDTLIELTCKRLTISPQPDVIRSIALAACPSPLNDSSKELLTQ